MSEEEIAMLIIGMWLGMPLGWFLKSVSIRRRDARRVAGEKRAGVEEDLVASHPFDGRSSPGKPQERNDTAN